MPGSTDTSLLVMHCPCNVQIELLLLFLRSDRLKSAAAALCNGVAFILTIGHAMATYVNEGASKWPPRTNTSISSRDNNRAGGDYSRHRLVDSGASPYTRYSEDRNSQKPLSPYNAFAKLSMSGKEYYWPSCDLEYHWMCMSSKIPLKEGWVKFW